MNPRTLIVATLLTLGTSLTLQAEIKITVGHNNNDDAKLEFKFQNVPSPAKTNAAATAKFSIVSGEMDPAGGDLSKLNDGKLPDDSDQPGENFFFNADTSGGRLEADLGKVIGIKQINSYSWHPDTRAPQVYKLYASDGTAEKFNATPTNGINPASCGWKLIASVNTKAKDNDANGGQYGVSVSDTDGVIGKYRYLLFDISATETDDGFGNTFFSEINVIDASGTDVKTAADSIAPSLFTIKTADGKSEITFKTDEAPELKDWAENQLAPVLAEWYPKIAALLPSEGYTAPAHFSVTLKPVKGVAYTAGTKVVANSAWLAKELHGEAIGSIVHELVHVVQQYHGNNPGWLVEGTADYVRWFKYEPQSHGADNVWLKKVGKINSSSYNDSYRFTANFLTWVSGKYDSNIVAELNAAMRTGKYDPDLWSKYTGKTAPELGDEWKKQLE